MVQIITYLIKVISRVMNASHIISWCTHRTSLWWWIPHQSVGDVLTRLHFDDDLTRLLMMHSQDYSLRSSATIRDIIIWQLVMYSPQYWWCVTYILVMYSPGFIITRCIFTAPFMISWRVLLIIPGNCWWCTHENIGEALMGVLVIFQICTSAGTAKLYAHIVWSTFDFAIYNKHQ